MWPACPISDTQPPRASVFFNPMNYLIPLTLVLAACFGLQSLALGLIGGRTTKSESNFFSSLARIQTGVRDEPRIMLLGSSLTGRFPDRTSGFSGVANLGCDGGNALDTLRAMDAGILPAAPIIVIEGNTLYRSVDGLESETSKALRSPWFRIGNLVPAFGATARPSAFAYSKLLAGKIGTAEGPAGPSLPVDEKPLIRQNQQPLPADAKAVLEETSAIIDRLRQRGIRLMLVILPPGGVHDSLNMRIPASLSGHAGVPLLDLASSLPEGAVRYTDGVHMDAPSAAAALRSILRALDDL
jgi:hypothetical protein